MVAGRLAASGDFRDIRRLMTDRPHTLPVHSSDDRALAAALIAEASVVGGRAAAASRLTCAAGDFGAFTRGLPRIARAAGIRLLRTDARRTSPWRASSPTWCDR